MTRHYLRIDPMLYERKVIRQGYTLPEFGAYVATLTLAESQPDRGRFRDERLLRALLGPGSRHVKTLMERGDLVSLPDGRIYIDGWDEWQEGDVTVAERVARIRNRKKVTVPTVTSETPDRLSGSGSGSGSAAETALSQDEPYVVAFYNVARRAPTKAQRAVLYELWDRHSTSWLIANLIGQDPLGAAMEADARWRREQRDRAAAEEREAERRRKRERAEATQELARLTGGAG